ncbi:precorrin-3B synthase [Yinghuangia sp. YIM S09857]|uniref:precorrin-3B synthase n=1 Tax=Yinghuangia sp. YIM S09857 TaxID=3436929 RepID=UPI003F53D7D7
MRERTDACPGTLDAAPADDGLVARIRLPGGRVSANQIGELTACAVELGRGSVDLTARANVQVRGLSTDGVGELARRLGGVGLLPSAMHDRVRNILASPFAGRAPGALVDADALVTALDAALCADPELAALPGRFQFALDDGTLPVATARHDVSLVAVAPGVVALRLAGVDTRLRGTSCEEAVDLATSAARVFLRASRANGAWHVRELPGGAEGLADALAHERLRAHEHGAVRGREAGTAREKAPVGLLPQADGRWCISALVPLGRLNASQLAMLTGFAAHPTPSYRIRVAPWRGVVVGDIPEGRVHAVAAELDAVGLPSHPDSPWHGVSACSGLGECRRARADVRSLARDFVARRRDGDGSTTAVHFAACARGCGRPPGASLMVVEDDGTPVSSDALPARTELPYPANPERPSWTTG